MPSPSQGWSVSRSRRSRDELVARLREVRSLEETRRQHGLSAGYIAEPEAERRAIERLVQLAGRRPRGLIARAEQAPETGGSMTVRLTAAPFAPASDDAPLYLLAPTSLPSSALATNVEAVALQGAKLRLVHDVAEIPHDEPALVLNWGGLGDLRSRHVVLNRPEAVRVSSDQLESLRALRELAPRTVLNPQDLHLLGGDQVVAKRRHGSRGSGKRVVAASESVQELARFDLYQEFGRQRREYRVSVLSGRVVSACDRPADGAGGSVGRCRARVDAGRVPARSDRLMRWLRQRSPTLEGKLHLVRLRAPVSHQTPRPQPAGLVGQSSRDQVRRCRSRNLSHTRYQTIRLATHLSGYGSIPMPSTAVGANGSESSASRKKLSSSGRSSSSSRVTRSRKASDPSSTMRSSTSGSCSWPGQRRPRSTSART